MIQEKLTRLEKEGILEEHKKQVQAYTLKKLQRPTPVTTIQTTKKPRVFYKNPSITLSNDLKDHQGHVIYPKGTTINPLKYRALTNLLVFIDGDEIIQRKWAFSLPNAIIILIKGAPFELMKKAKRPIYFDQQGLLVRQLGIQQAPARVTQSGDHLKIEEIRL